MICLDNSVLSRLASPRPSPAVDDYLSDHAAEPWTVPATVAFEYYAHYDSQDEVRSQRQELNDHLDGVLPFTDAVASEAAQLRVALSGHDTSLGAADLFHAATARETGAVFVTRDTDDFDSSPVKQLLDIDLIRTPD